MKWLNFHWKIFIKCRQSNNGWFLHFTWEENSLHRNKLSSTYPIWWPSGCINVVQVRNMVLTDKWTWIMCLSRAWSAKNPSGEGPSLHWAAFCSILSGFHDKYYGLNIVGVQCQNYVRYRILFVKIFPYFMRWERNIKSERMNVRLSVITL